MNKPINLLVGGLTLFAAQGCKAPKQASQQAEHPNIIYVFPDQYRNQAMGFWRQDGFRDKVNFEVYQNKHSQTCFAEHIADTFRILA